MGDELKAHAGEHMSMLSWYYGWAFKSLWPQHPHVFIAPPSQSAKTWIWFFRCRSASFFQQGVASCTYQSLYGMKSKRPNNDSKLSIMFGILISVNDVHFYFLKSTVTLFYSITDIFLVISDGNPYWSDCKSIWTI